MADVTSIRRTDLETIDDLEQEARSARAVIEPTSFGLLELRKHGDDLLDRYAGAPFGTGGIARAVEQYAEATAPLAGIADQVDEAVAAIEDAIREARAAFELAETIDARGDIRAFRAA